MLCGTKRLLGLVLFSEVRKDRHKACLELELAAPSIKFDQTEHFTNRMKKFKKRRDKPIEHRAAINRSEKSGQKAFQNYLPNSCL
jgi:hypothetical protein